MKTSSILLALIAASLPAQHGPLVGFGADPTGANAAMLRQALCNPANVACTQVLPGPTEAWAGGAAVDPRRNTMWHSEGTRLFQVGLYDCAPGCAQPARVVLGGASRVGGLTFDAANSELVHVESVPGMAALVTYGFASATDCATYERDCRVVLPTNLHQAGAIAYNSKADVFFVAASRFAAGLDPQNRILVVDRRCGVRCFLPAQNCGRSQLAAIRAMTFEACTDRLYVSDGRQTVVYVATENAAGCFNLQSESCCPVAAPQGQFYAGFDLAPIDRGQLGGGCLPRRTCSPCATPPTLETLGAAFIGNPWFGFRIEDAPSAANAFVLIQPGGCQAVAFGCGTLFAPAAPLFLGGVLTAGPDCAATADFALPIPAAHSLCGLLLCAQGVLVCRGGGIGLTNAKVVPVQG